MLCPSNIVVLCGVSLGSGSVFLYAGTLIGVYGLCASYWLFCDGRSAWDLRGQSLILLERISRLDGARWCVDGAELERIGGA